MSSDYRVIVRGIRELHRLTLEGMDESPEADAVRDAMDTPWEALSESERMRVNGLSADLYSISDPPYSDPKIWTTRGGWICYDPPPTAVSQVPAR